MKVEHYNQAVRAGLTRRRLLQGAASIGGAAALGGFGLRPAYAQDNLRAEILKIPGVGAGSPTDADWQKVGELCLGATKANVAEGEFAGVELTFMGLNNQNQHNFLFRGFLKSWETYTGARSTGSTLRRPIITRACSRRLRLAPLISTSSKWAHRLKATPPARACWMKCPIG